jgi:hypothetical protein
MNSNMTLANSTRVRHFCWLSNSVCIEDQKDSIMALSRPWPTVPNERISPAEQSLSPKAHEVNCTRWLACTILRLKVSMAWQQ